MNFELVIVNESNKFFSGVKINSPKMYNALKGLCEQYKETFKSEYKVKRVIRIKSGYKFI